MGHSKKMTAQGPARNSRTGKNVLEIQKVINQDYAHLTKDYGKLFVEMYRSRYGKLALLGVGIVACLPLFRKLMAIPAVDTFIQTNVTERMPWKHDGVDNFLDAH